MSINLRDVVIDPALSDVSVKYTNSSFIADVMLPVVQVGKQSGKYYIYDKSNLRPDKTGRAAGSGSNEVESGLSLSGVFFADDNALKAKVPFEVIDQAEQALDPLIDETEAVTEKLLIAREISAAALLTSTSSMTQNTTLSGASQWSDYTNSDPIADIRTAKNTIHANSLKKANVLMLSQTVFNTLADHPKVIARVQYSQLGVVTEELLARLFNVDKVVVGEAGYNSAKEGQSDSLAYVWGKNAVLAYVAPRMSLKTLTLGATFQYKQRIVEKWDDRDARATYIRVGDDYYTQKLIAVECGYLIKNAIA